MVRGEELRFKEEGVKDVVRDVLLPWYNAFRFLVQSIRRMERHGEWRCLEEGLVHSDNVMDMWIQAACAGLVQFTRQEMEAYRLYTVSSITLLISSSMRACMHATSSSTLRKGCIFPQ